MTYDRTRAAKGNWLFAQACGGCDFKSRFLSLASFLHHLFFVVVLSFTTALQ